MTQPFLLPWVRVLLLIRSISSTTWGREAWPEVKPVLRRPLEKRRLDRAGGLVELNAHGRRLRAVLGLLLLLHRWLDTWTSVGLIAGGMHPRGRRQSLSDIAEDEWRAQFVSDPMGYPGCGGFGGSAVGPCISFRR